MSTLIEIADAVAAMLNTAFKDQFTAKRAYRPVFELEGLTDLTVTVVPKSIVTEIESREKSQFDYAVDVGIVQKVDTDDDTVLDALMGVVEQVADHLCMRDLASPQAAWLSLDNTPAYSQEHLAKQRVFMSVLTVTYRLSR